MDCIRGLLTDYPHFAVSVSEQKTFDLVTGRSGNCREKISRVRV